MVAFIKNDIWHNASTTTISGTMLVLHHHNQIDSYKLQILQIPVYKSQFQADEVEEAGIRNVKPTNKQQRHKYPVSQPQPVHLQLYK